MKTIDIITALNRYIDNLDEEKKGNYKYSLEKQIYNFCDVGILAELMNKLQADYRNEEAKKRGGNKLLKRQKLIEKLLKENSKTNKEQFSKCWIETIGGDDMQIYTNGFFIIALKKDSMVNVETIVDVPENHFKAEKFLVEFKENYNLKELEFDLVDIKQSFAQHMAYQKTKKPIYRDDRYLIEIGNALYNAEYFIDCVEALGDNVIFYQNEFNNQGSYFENENGIAMLLPCKW